MPKTLKEIPDFKSEDDERAFWESHDSTDFIDWSRAKPVSFPNLQPSTRTISLRLPVSMLEELRLSGSPVTDQGLAHLSAITTLRELALASMARAISSWACAWGRSLR